MRPTNSKLKYFFPRFLLWTILLQTFVWQIGKTPWIINSIENNITEITASIISPFYSNTLVNNNKLIHDDSNRYVVVDKECTALALVATLIASIFSLPYSISKKLLMAFCATILIQIENVIRIVHLYYEVKQPINQFAFYHLYVWQIINFFSAIGIFFLLDWFFKNKVKHNESV